MPIDVASENEPLTDDASMRQIVTAHVNAALSGDIYGFIADMHPDMITSRLDWLRENQDENMTYKKWIELGQESLEKNLKNIGDATVTWEILEIETRTDQKSIEYWFDDVRWEWGAQNASAVAWVYVDMTIDGEKLSEPVDIILAKIQSKWYIINSELD